MEGDRRDRAHRQDAESDRVELLRKRRQIPPRMIDFFRGCEEAWDSAGMLKDAAWDAEAVRAADEAGSAK